MIDCLCPFPPTHLPTHSLHRKNSHPFQRPTPSSRSSRKEECTSTYPHPPTHPPTHPPPPPGRTPTHPRGLPHLKGAQGKRGGFPSRHLSTAPHPARDRGTSTHPPNHPPIPSAHSTKPPTFSPHPLDPPTHSTHPPTHPHKAWIERHYPGIFSELHFGNHYSGRWKGGWVGG